MTPKILSNFYQNKNYQTSNYINLYEKLCQSGAVLSNIQLNEIDENNRIISSTSTIDVYINDIEK